MVIWIQLGGSHLLARSAREVALLLFQLLKIKGEGSSSELNCFRCSESSFPVASMPFGCHACFSGGGGGGHDYQPDNQLHSRLPTPPPFVLGSNASTTDKVTAPGHGNKARVCTERQNEAQGDTAAEKQLPYQHAAEMRMGPEVFDR